MRGLGSLANLAKILEAASNPESDLREDRQKPKKVLHGKRVSAKKAVDPKRKAWHERRLKELNKKAPVQAAAAKPASPAVPTTDPKAAKAVAAGLSGSLISALAAAKPGAAKPDSQNKRQEAWKRKPGDPVF
ncbi:MAG TPA: hypothetical protein VJ623_09885 [Holophagaceae bacterium]|nr:hypothetical protein [Holophagaceae bacterium]